MRALNTAKDIAKTLLLFVGILGAILIFSKFNETVLVGPIRIMDGDSLRLEGQEIRLLGIDAPEFNQKCTKKSGSDYTCGRVSRDYLKRLISSHKVECSGSTYDKYERLLAVCKAGDVELNRQMVLSGWAVSFGSYSSEEREAKNNGAGLWSGGFQAPAQWRRDMKESHNTGFLSALFGW